MLIIDAPYYRSIGQEEEVFKHAYSNKLPLLLKGPTGTGKSRFVEYMAYQLKKPIITIACHEETSATDLLGRYIIKGAETIWQRWASYKSGKRRWLFYIWMK